MSAFDFLPWSYICVACKRLRHVFEIIGGGKGGGGVLEAISYEVLLDLLFFIIKSTTVQLPLFTMRSFNAQQ